jgi:hypothetical protein
MEAHSSEPFWRTTRNFTLRGILFSRIVTALISVTGADTSVRVLRAYGPGGAGEIQLLAEPGGMRGGAKFRQSSLVEKEKALTLKTNTTACWYVYLSCSMVHFSVYDNRQMLTR